MLSTISKHDSPLHVWNNSILAVTGSPITKYVYITLAEWQQYTLYEVISDTQISAHYLYTVQYTTSLDISRKIFVDEKKNYQKFLRR